MINQWEIRPDDDVRRERKSATVEVSAEALLSLLMAPKDMSIAGVSWDGRSIELTVTHPALEAVNEGADLPILNPRYSIEYQNSQKVNWGEELEIAEVAL